MIKALFFGQNLLRREFGYYDSILDCSQDGLWFDVM